MWPSVPTKPAVAPFVPLSTIKPPSAAVLPLATPLLTVITESSILIFSVAVLIVVPVTVKSPETVKFWALKSWLVAPLTLAALIALLACCALNPFKPPPAWSWSLVNTAKSFASTSAPIPVTTFTALPFAVPNVSAVCNPASAAVWFINSLELLSYANTSLSATLDILTSVNEFKVVTVLSSAHSIALPELLTFSILLAP